VRFGNYNTLCHLRVLDGFVGDPPLRNNWGYSLREPAIFIFNLIRGTVLE
jgi:hypothetical protein